MAHKSDVGTCETSKRIAEQIAGFVESRFPLRKNHGGGVTELWRKPSWFPPFAKCAKNGAPAFSVRPARSKARAVADGVVLGVADCSVIPRRVGGDRLGSQPIVVVITVGHVAVAQFKHVRAVSAARSPIRFVKMPRFSQRPREMEHPRVWSQGEVGHPPDTHPGPGGGSVRLLAVGGRTIFEPSSL